MWVIDTNWLKGVLKRSREEYKFDVVLKEKIREA